MQTHHYPKALTWCSPEWLESTALPLEGGGLLLLLLGRLRGRRKEPPQLLMLQGGFQRPSLDLKDFLQWLSTP